MLTARFVKRGQNARAKKTSGDLTRRTPHQARAKETLDAIYEATARILERRGRKALNTNYIAARAGICIGTLYQYFPNKEAILISMARSVIESDGAALDHALSKGVDESGEEPHRLLIRALIAELEKRRETRRAVIDTLIAEGLGSEGALPAQTLADRIAAKIDRLFPACFYNTPFCIKIHFRQGQFEDFVSILFVYIINIFKYLILKTNWSPRGLQ